MAWSAHILETSDGYFEREVHEMADAVDLAYDEHERMRRVGMHVVPYEIRDISDGKLLRAERVAGTLLEELPEPLRRREMGAVAIGWYHYYYDAYHEDAPYILSDMDNGQFMYGTTSTDTIPRTYLVDIDPSLIDMRHVQANPEGTYAQLFDEEMHGTAWAQHYWQEAGLINFPYRIPTDQDMHNWLLRSTSQAQSAWLTGGN